MAKRGLQSYTPFYRLGNSRGSKRIRTRDGRHRSTALTNVKISTQHYFQVQHCLSMEETKPPITLCNKAVAPPSSSPLPSIPEMESSLCKDCLTQHTDTRWVLPHSEAALLPVRPETSQGTEEQRHRPAGSERDGASGQARALSNPCCLMFYV